MATYETAAICMSGDIITPVLHSRTELENFCTACGAKVITVCPFCNEPIRGREKISPWVNSGVRYSLPLYCHNCGKPYPWTQSALDAASELIDEEMQELNTEEKSKFKDALPDVIAQTPRTTLAAKRVSKYLNKIAPTVQETFKQIFYRLAAEGAKILIWGL